MDRRERAADLDTAILAAILGHQASVWTAMPAIVLSYNPAHGTCELQPSTRGRLRLQDGTITEVDLPPLVDCPVVFPSGGGHTLTFPIKAGDEALVVFASRCIDSWWDSGGVQSQAEMRMHDLSDGFAIVGPRARPNVHAGMSTDGVELRNQDRTSLVRINDTGGVVVETDGDVTVTAGGVINLTAPSVNIIGNVAITGTLSNNGTNVGSTHVHSGVAAGTSNTEAPV